MKVYERRRKRGGNFRFDKLKSVNPKKKIFLTIEKTSELRKKECSSLTISRNYEGWVELDIKMAVKQWEKPSKNLGLSVEVQDINESYLRTLDFFHPIDCNQACKCVI